MTMLHYAETKKPERRRFKDVRFKGIGMTREFLLALSDGQIIDLSKELQRMYARAIKAERDRLLREVLQERSA